MPDLYWLTRDPAPLCGMSHPGATTDWNALHDAGLGAVVCLASERPSYDPAPLALLAAVQLEDLVAGGAPANPEREQALIEGVVERITTHLVEKRRGVVVHCLAGRGRTGTVLGCVLVRLGEPPEDVIRRLDAVHRARSGRGWPESPWQAERVRGFGEKG